MLHELRLAQSALHPGTYVIKAGSCHSAALIHKNNDHAFDGILRSVRNLAVLIAEDVLDELPTVPGGDIHRGAVGLGKQVQRFLAFQLLPFALELIFVLANDAETGCRRNSLCTSRL